MPTVFIRLTGCPLRCGYCDTEYAFQGGEWLDQQHILDKVASFSPNYITVTGGEPLAQRPCRQLLSRLCDQHYQVSLETSGALDISNIDERVSIVMDIKTPGSGEESRNLISNIDYLKPGDQVKFVITDRRDYDWSRHMISQYKIDNKSEILLSPVYGQLAPRELADWMLADGIQARLQLQLHKILWGEEPGH